MIGVKRLENVRELAQRAIDEGIPGDFIETGVWRGGCCILMRGILAANLINDRRIYVADSFAGLPPPNAEAFPSDKDWNLHLYKELTVSLEEVKDNFTRYGLLDDQVVFVKGFFSDTLPSLNAGPFCLMRLDGDYYESTYVALEALYPKLSPGGFVILDDVNFIPPCRQAVMDYRSRMGITAVMYNIDWNAGWWQKPHASY
jgi:O-methyltransferase/8-demethyl-8-(2,3-dimethoxy-alpha-L-rhamnosyl)tetracenomycin-C 4'-O-methyltransferase